MTRKKSRRSAAKKPPAQTATAHTQKTAPTVRGNLSVHPRGFGFVNRPEPHDDIFIPKPLMNGAIDGDTVEVVVSPGARGKGPEGRVVAVIERKRKKIVGTVVDVTKKKAEIFSSILGEMHPIECAIQKSHPLNVGERVILDVLSWGQKKEPTRCRLSSSLGSIDDPATDVGFAIAENDIREPFSTSCIQEAKSLGNRVKTADLTGRADLRHL